MTIKARLDGHPHDLAELLDQFPAGDPHIGVDDVGTYLTATEFDANPDDLGKLHATASSLLTYMIGIARASNAGFRPVKLTGRFDDEAGRTSKIVFAESAEARLGFGRPYVSGDGVVQPRFAPGPRYLEAAKSHPDVQEVLGILGNPARTLGWVELYKVYEIIRHSVGDVPATGWVTTRDSKTFTESANRPEVSGADARHARLPGDPSGRRMTLVEGRQWISGLVTAWLNSL